MPLGRRWVVQKPRQCMIARAVDPFRLQKMMCTVEKLSEKVKALEESQPWRDLEGEEKEDSKRWHNQKIQLLGMEADILKEEFESMNLPLEEDDVQPHPQPEPIPGPKEPGA